MANEEEELPEELKELETHKQAIEAEITRIKKARAGIATAVGSGHLSTPGLAEVLMGELVNVLEVMEAGFVALSEAVDGSFQYCDDIATACEEHGIEVGEEGTEGTEGTEGEEAAEEEGDESFLTHEDASVISAPIVSAIAELTDAIANGKLSRPDWSSLLEQLESARKRVLELEEPVEEQQKQ